MAKPVIFGSAQGAKNRLNGTNTHFHKAKMASTKDIRLIVRAELESAINNLNRLEDELDDLNNTAQQSNDSFKYLAAGMAAFVAVLAVKKIAEFSFESAKLTDRANDLRSALNKLANKEGVDVTKLMVDLRNATANTVSDLELMRTATQSKFAGTDLRNLPVLFEYARRRAAETDTDVQNLVDTITKGVGEKSIDSLKSLGGGMNNIESEIRRMAYETGNWNGKIDENVKNLYLQKAAINIAKNELKGMAEPTEGLTTNLQKMNAQWENFKILMGELSSGPISDVFAAINDGLEKINKSISREGKLEKLRKDLERTDDQIGKMENGQLSFMDKFSKAVGLYDSRLKTLKANRQLTLDQIKQIESELEKLNSSNNSAVVVESLNFPLDDKYKQILKEKVKASFKVDLFVDLKESLNDLTFLDPEKEQAEVERIQRLSREYENFMVIVDESRELFYGLDSAFMSLTDSLVDSATKGSEAWKNFFDDLKRQIARFLISQIVRTFLNLFFGAIFPGASLPFGKTIFSAIAGGSSASATSAVAGVAGGGGSLAAGGFGLANLTAPQPLPAGGGGFITKQSYIEKTTPVSGRIIVETIAPEMTRVKQYHIDVEDRIAEPHRNRKQRQRRDGTDGIWK